MSKSNNSQEIDIYSLFVTHAKISEIWRSFDSLIEGQKYIERGSSPRNVFIVGESGTGKTQLAKHYLSSHPVYIIEDDEGTQYDIRPVVYMVLSEPFTIASFYRDIIKALGAPIVKGKPTIDELKHQAVTLLKKQKVELLIIDEMGSVMVSRFVKQYEAMETIKHISNVSNISLALIGTPNTKELLKLDFQYYRRFTLLRLERFANRDKDFMNFLQAISRQLKPILDINIDDIDSMVPDILHKLSKGIVGIITPILQQAYIIAKQETGNDLDAKINLDNLQAASKIIIGDTNEQEFEKLLVDQSRKFLA